MNQNQLADLLRPLLEARGLELETLSVTNVGKRRLIRLSVDGDGPEGRGPMLDEIAEASNAISAALDTASFVGNAPFTLEVSSRGVSKPLTEPKHFRRNMDRLVKLWLSGREVVGRIVAADDQQVVIDISGVATPVRLADVSKAVVQVEMNRPTDELDLEEES